VCHYRDKFYMVYSGRVRGGSQWEMRMALAVSDRPEGPYKDLYAPWFDFGYSAIDGHIFVDDDGKPYLFFSRNESRDGYSYGAVCGIVLADDLSELLGEPTTLIEASQPWERVTWATNRCNEAPAVVKHNGTYYMTYSANMHNLPVYGIGVATAQHPLGPWTKFEGNPIVATDPSSNLVAPGHSSIARSPDGTELFMVYHRHEEAVSPDDSPVVSPRLVCIDRFFFDADGNLLLKGPTRTPQPMPSGAPSPRATDP
jgi:beta-xylosidase